MAHPYLFCLLLPWLPALAQAQQPDSTARPWYVPRHVVIQTAGGIGMVAGGAGYTLGRQRRLEADVLVGYVPGKYTGKAAFSIFTLKGNYSPFTLPLAPHWQVKPLSVGMLVNHTPAAALNKSRDDKYSPGYYWWSSRTRLGLFLGGRISRELPGGTARPAPRRASLYYELGTNDLYTVSFFQNPKGLSFHQILTLGLGAKFDL